MKTRLSSACQYSPRNRHTPYIKYTNTYARPGHNQIETNLSSDCQHSPGNRHMSYITCTQTHTHNHNQTEMNLSSICQRFLKRGGLKVWEDGAGLWLVSFCHCGRERTRRRRGQSWCMPNVKWGRPVKILHHVHCMRNINPKAHKLWMPIAAIVVLKDPRKNLKVNLCVCVCARVCSNVCAKVCEHAFACTLCVYIYTYMHVYLWMCVNTLYTYTYTLLLIYVCVCVCVLAPVCV